MSWHCRPGGPCPYCNDTEPNGPEEEQMIEPKQVWYLAHPVSGDIFGNLANAIAWLHWLTINVPQRIYIAPWVAEVQAFTADIGTSGAEADAAFYDRVLADDCEVVRRCDGVLMVGGKVSRGMDIEADAALMAGLEVVDLTHFREPPGKGDTSATSDLLRR